MHWTPAVSPCPGKIGEIGTARRKPHQSEEAIEAVEATGARVEPLPPWSPDLSPIEEMVSKVKGAMRSAGARTTNAVYWAFASALDQVTLNDIAGWFQSRAAYAMRL